MFKAQIKPDVTEFYEKYILKKESVTNKQGKKIKGSKFVCDLMNASQKGKSPDWLETYNIFSDDDKFLLLTTVPLNKVLFWDINITGLDSIIFQLAQQCPDLLDPFFISNKALELLTLSSKNHGVLIVYLAKHHTNKCINVLKDLENEVSNLKNTDLISWLETATTNAIIADTLFNLLLRSRETASLQTLNAVQLYNLIIKQYESGNVKELKILHELAKYNEKYWFDNLQCIFEQDVNKLATLLNLRVRINISHQNPQSDTVYSYSFGPLAYYHYKHWRKEHNCKDLFGKCIKIFDGEDLSHIFFQNTSAHDQYNSAINGIPPLHSKYGGTIFFSAINEKSRVDLSVEVVKKLLQEKALKKIDESELNQVKEILEICQKTRPESYLELLKMASENFKGEELFKYFPAPMHLACNPKATDQIVSACIMTMMDKLPKDLFCSHLKNNFTFQQLVGYYSEPYTVTYLGVLANQRPSLFLEISEELYGHFGKEHWKELLFDKFENTSYSAVGFYASAHKNDLFKKFLDVIFKCLEPEEAFLIFSTSSAVTHETDGKFFSVEEETPITLLEQILIGSLDNFDNVMKKLKEENSAQDLLLLFFKKTPNKCTYERLVSKSELMKKDRDKYIKDIIVWLLATSYNDELKDILKKMGENIGGIKEDIGNYIIEHHDEYQNEDDEIISLETNIGRILFYSKNKGEACLDGSKIGRKVIDQIKGAQWGMQSGRYFNMWFDAKRSKEQKKRRKRVLN